MDGISDSIISQKISTIEIFKPYLKNEEINGKKKYKNIKYKRYIIFMCFIFLGFINHLGYYLILTSSQQFSSKLGNDSLIACYPLALIIFGSFTRIINSKFCINISYYIRVIFLSIYFFIGYVTLFFILQNSNIHKNNNVAFWLTMIPTTIMGTGESFGEVTILGYIGTFNGNFISGWNIGSALAGVSGSFLSLLFKRLNTDLKYVYLILSPISVLYLFIFMFINCFGRKEKKSNSLIKKYEKIHEKNIHINNNNIHENKILNCKNFKEGIVLSKKYIINLTSINYLQYTICYCFCERANKFKCINSKGSIFESAQYETLLFFYEIGVVISNSCAFLIKHINHIEIFTYFQIINFILWYFESILGYISNQWICFIHLFFVGFCGGGANIGILENMFNSKNIVQRFQELCLNICEFFMDWGILLSSLTSIFFDNTILKEYR